MATCKLTEKKSQGFLACFHHDTSQSHPVPRILRPEKSSLPYPSFLYLPLSLLLSPFLSETEMMASKGYFIAGGSFVLAFEFFILPICYMIDKYATLNTEFHNVG